MMNTRQSIEGFLSLAAEQPESITFDQCIEIIDQHYDFTPTAFKNGNQHNAAGQNEGSCKILAFAQLHNLTQQQTLHCFGDYYRKDVISTPEGDSHQNIRQFMQHGWERVEFDSVPLTRK